MQWIKSIYKFCSVNDYSLSNLKNNNLLCNHYAKFNDPFECWCVINTGIPNHKTETERFLNVIAVWGFNPERANDALEDYYDYLQHFEEDQIDVGFHVNSARICCFSSEDTNLLMWAHYGDGLRGFCIEFDLEALLLENQFDARIIDVNYSSIPPVLETISYPLANDIYWHAEDEDSDKAVDYMTDFYSKMLASKPLQWQYEKEVRLIFHSKRVETEGEFYNYPQSAIKAIVIGEKMSEQDRNKIYEILKQKEVKIPVRVAKRDKNSYNVSIHDT